MAGQQEEQQGQNEAASTSVRDCSSGSDVSDGDSARSSSLSDRAFYYQVRENFEPSGNGSGATRSTHRARGHADTIGVGSYCGSTWAASSMTVPSTWSSAYVGKSALPTGSSPRITTSPPRLWTTTRASRGSSSGNLARFLRCDVVGSSHGRAGRRCTARPPRRNRHRPMTQSKTPDGRPWLIEKGEKLWQQRSGAECRASRRTERQFSRGCARSCGAFRDFRV